MTAKHEDQKVQQAAFAERCQLDIGFTEKALAAVLANEETSEAFAAELVRQAPGSNHAIGSQGGLRMNSPTQFSYSMPSVTQQLTLSISSGNAPSLSATAATNAPQMILIGYNGGNWIGLLPEAIKIIQYVPMGAIITSLTQALFGTKAGLALLAALLAPK